MVLIFFEVAAGKGIVLCFVAEIKLGWVGLGKALPPGLGWFLFEAGELLQRF